MGKNSGFSMEPGWEKKIEEQIRQNPEFQALEAELNEGLNDELLAVVDARGEMTDEQILDEWEDIIQRRGAEPDRETLQTLLDSYVPE